MKLSHIHSSVVVVSAFFTCFILLLAACPINAATTVIPVTGSFTLADQIVDGYLYNVSTLTSSSNSSINYVTECTIEGDGIGFKAFNASVSNSSIALFNLTMAQTTVTNATIAITGYFPPYSTLMISYTTATMQGSTPLFDFRYLVLENHVVVYTLATVATWNNDGTGGDVILVGGTTRQLFTAYSGFYIVDTNATYASHILHQVLPMCTSSVQNCLDVNNGLIAIDVASCNNCTGEFLRSEHTVVFLTGAYGGTVRLSNCTSVGGQAFIGAAGTRSLQYSSNGNIIFYGIITDGVLFSSGTKVPTLIGSGFMSFMHINAVSTGSTTSLPTTSDTNTVWAGNITFGGTYMSTLSALQAKYVSPNYFLDPYSKVVSTYGTAEYSETVNSVSSVFCARPGFSNSSWEVLSTWERGHCNCASGSYGAMCTQVPDVVLYYVNYNAADVKVECNVANCTTCLALTSEQCTQCDAGFKLNSATCRPKGCNAANCSTCVFDSETDCAVCDGNFKRGSDNTTCVSMTCNAENCDTCVTEEDSVCQNCSANYNLNADGNCTEMVCQAANCNTCVFDTEDKCEVCDGNYKRGSDNVSCVAMACTAENCATCVTEENATCQNCSTNYKLASDGTSCTEMVCQAANCSTCVFGTEDLCAVCDGNYKRGSDNTTCVAMTCNAENCDTCVTEENSTCQNCSTNYNLNANGNCTEMVCQAANCNTCVFDTEDKCEVCDGNFKRGSDNVSCVAMACTAENCATCVTEENATCQNCSTNYNLNSNGTCTEMVCHAANCSTCVFGTEDLCAVCDGNFKRGSDNVSCVPMTCLAEDCDTCVTEKNSVCQNCSANYKLDADGKTCTEKVCHAKNCFTCVFDTEDECSVCDGNFKRGSDNVSCVAMTCSAPNCSVCVTEKNGVCQNCSTNYKLNSDNGTCTAMVCQVESCSKCADNAEDSCATCSSGYSVSSSGGCAADGSSSGLSTSTIIGIAAAIGALAVLLALFLLIFFCCCKKKKATIHALENVNPLERRLSVNAEEMESVPNMDGIVRRFDSDAEGQEGDAGYTVDHPESDTEAEVALQSRLSRYSRRSARSARSQGSRRSNMLISDIELESLFQQDEIQESDFSF